MSFELEYLDLMPHTVVLTAPTGHNAQGQPTYVGGVPKSYRARVFGIMTSIRTMKSSMESPAFMAYVAAGNDTVHIDYRLQLPNDPVFGVNNPFIFAIERMSDEDGNHHVKLVCGFSYSHQTAL